ncbi:hypothetical protein [Paracandidimonas soli]|uniref:hypothetical protein n=1 Tax=Paracandidimonas soli TaxID=1917182 RepID=UPI00334292AB
MRSFDFSSWHTLLPTLLGLAFITLIGVGIRLVVMQTIQLRRERENRRINERLRALMAAYKTLGGSFTGNLTVDPRHLRDLRRAGATEADQEFHDDPSDAEQPLQSRDAGASDRPRRIRDAVEAALSDILLLGTEEQVRLAARAATELSQGRPIHTAELVVSLRDYIRGVLSLEPVPQGVAIPAQGPTRPSGGRGSPARDSSKAGGGGRGGGMGAGGGMGVGAGLGLRRMSDDQSPS